MEFNKISILSILSQIVTKQSVSKNRKKKCCCNVEVTTQEKNALTGWEKQNWVLCRLSLCIMRTRNQKLLVAEKKSCCLCKPDSYKSLCGQIWTRDATTQEDKGSKPNWFIHCVEEHEQERSQRKKTKALGGCVNLINSFIMWKNMNKTGHQTKNNNKGSKRLCKPNSFIMWKSMEQEGLRNNTRRQRL